MVKDSIYHNPDTGLMTQCDKLDKVFVVPQPAIGQTIIPGVITMGRGFKQRSDIKGGAA